VKPFDKEHYDGMGEFNNALVDLIDQADLQPEEVVAVLEMVSLRIKQLMISVRDASSRKPKEE